MRIREIFCTAAAALTLGAGVDVTPSVAQDGGEALSFTADQAARAQREYTRSCADCHGPNLDDGEFGGPPLRGVAFRDKWFGMPVDALYGFMSATMPPDRPGSLSVQTYADLTALILSHNGFEPGEVELPADLDALSRIMLE